MAPTTAATAHQQLLTAPLPSLDVGVPRDSPPNSTPNEMLQHVCGSSRGPPISNLPFPQEVRDMVHEHLLEGENVRVEADLAPSSVAYSEPHKYKFHTAVMAVNKHFYADASKVFHEKNDFVKVTIDWTKVQLDQDKMAEIPVITRKKRHVKRFKPHACHIAFRCAQLGKKTKRAVSFVMLAQDLPSVVHMLRWLTFSLPWDSKAEDDRGDSQVWHYAHSPRGKFEISTMITTRSTAHRNQDRFITRPEDNRILQKVLKSIGPMVFPGQKAGLYHLTSEKTMIRHNLLEAVLTAEIGASRVWPQAFLCSLLDYILDSKQRADDLALAGHSEQAIHIYLYIIKSCPRWDNRIVVAPASDWLVVCILQTLLDMNANVFFLLIAADRAYTRDFLAAWLEGFNYVYSCLFEAPITYNTPSVDQDKWWNSHSIHHAIALYELLLRRDLSDSPGNGPPDSLTLAFQYLKVLWMDQGGEADGWHKQDEAHHGNQQGEADNEIHRDEADNGIQQEQVDDGTQQGQADNGTQREQADDGTQQGQADDKTQHEEADDGAQQAKANHPDPHLKRDLLLIEYMISNHVAYSAFMSGRWDNDTMLSMLSVRKLGPRIVTTPMPKQLEDLRSRTERWTDKVAEKQYLGDPSNFR
ncbi:hypothetical protein CERZMDRAFT_102072 [Cercospora zeae-maydis SCOH1-5]|uniref:Uncharacterized protein n=1 Tax=Cercospora zeae-maydis SCOH1-5 TaxID=717836 RepID=A0A6A6F257_9PEZI|nr:hypothetical protein CERZMDRAFT_102072 [Cercospora zeae-maydis SCOH1-5]